MYGNRFRGKYSRKRLSFFVVERLDADRQPVYARFAQPGEVIPRQVVGVGLEGGFRGAGAGIDRLSIGIQSFDDDCLKLMNRRHTAARCV